MENISIRLASENDFDFIYHSINELEESHFPRPEQGLIFSKNLQDANIIYLVASEGPIAMGFLSCYFQHLLHHGGFVGEIQEMYIDPKYRNLNIGKSMLAKLESLSMEKGVFQLEVSSNIRRTDAHRFYEQCGYLKTSLKLIKPLFETAD
ncbi:MAG: GNAT family N-acetyltransferase [Saprospiraceae bacterium]|nr:GNAT family N-acetyltransferase [Saprospiraceae bacterium]